MIGGLRAYSVVVAATVVLNAMFITFGRLMGRTPGFGFGEPMGGGDCLSFFESHLGLIGLIGELWIFFIGWPGSNILLGLYLGKKLKLSKLPVLAVIFVVAPCVVVALWHLNPPFAPE